MKGTSRPTSDTVNPSPPVSREFSRLGSIQEPIYDAENSVDSVYLPEEIIDLDSCFEKPINHENLKDNSCNSTITNSNEHINEQNNADKQVDVTSDIQIFSSLGKLVQMANNNNVSLLYVKVTIDGCEIKAVLDTSVYQSLVHENLISGSNLIVNSEASSELTALGNDKIILNKSITTDVVVNGLPMRLTNCAIVPQQCCMPPLLILGVDFLRLNNLEISIANNLLIQHLPNDGSLEVPLGISDLDISSHNVLCICKDTITLKQRETKLIPAALLDIILDTDVGDVFYEADHACPVINGKANCFSGVMSNNKLCIMATASSNDFKIKRGTLMGTISTLCSKDSDDVDPNNSDVV